MTPARWQHITELFAQAVAQPPAQRAEFVRLACPGDAALQEAVEKLLAADAAAESFLAQPAVGAVASIIVEPPSHLAAGTRLGSYEIIKLLGAGGMGEVYRARDTKLKRQVALKVLSPALAGNADYVRRFTREARAVSLLNHPNILTIYEIGAQDGVQFIATEYVDGETLRQVLQAGGIELAKTLEIAVQVGYALASAHEAGLAHRDLKPENIMLRGDGIVKILDFGLAKTVATPGAAVDRAASTQSLLTGPGVVLGTVGYMSPEQARGQVLDARTDIWSWGVVLYELVTGRAPFVGATTADTMAAVLHWEPEPLRQYAPATPLELEGIVRRALSKEREGRYATAEEILADLKGLRENLALAARGDANATPAGRPTQATNAYAAPASTPATAPRPTGRVSGWAARLSPRWRVLPVLLAALALAGLVWAYRWYVKPATTLTEQDTILLTDFSNTTEDPIFDGTLKQGLAIALEQSPFLRIFQEDEAREALRLMNRAPDEPVTLETGREICLRHGLKALIKGSLERAGNKYAITLEAVQAVDGKVLAQARVEAADKGQVLTALGQAARELRPKLGESLVSLQQFDVPLPQTTTSSLEAFKALSLAHELENRGLLTEASSLYQRAVAIDPNFAYAYAALAALSANLNQPQLAAEYAAKAYQLRERVSSLENLHISAFYHFYVLGDLEKAIEATQLQKQTYRRDYRAPQNLSNHFLIVGQFVKAEAEARAALGVNPKAVAAHVNLGEALLRQDKFAESAASVSQAQQLGIDVWPFRYYLYAIAWHNQDTAAMQQQVAWAKGKPEEHFALDWQTNAAAQAGQWRLAQDFSRQAIDLALRNNAPESAAQYAAEQALRAAVLGHTAQAQATARQSLTLTRNQVTLTRAALALALCGDVAQTQKLWGELRQQYPQATLVNSLWLPAIKAAVALHNGQAEQALEELQMALRYEHAGEFWPQYVRGQAYLKLNQGPAAAAEFRKILEQRGEAPLSVLSPLAHLGLARAATLAGEEEQARRSAEAFFMAWREADAGGPVLAAARRAYPSR